MTNYDTMYEKPSGVPEPSNSPRVVTRLLLTGVRGYQVLRGGRVSACRFYPSCSEYAVEALNTHGAVRGAYLSARRILRCNPFGPHGVDLVPLPREKRS